MTKDKGPVVVVGILQIELGIPDAFSLKDKRQSVRSLKDRMRRHHNVSVAEVGALEEHRRSILGVAMVGSDKVYIEGALSKLADMVRAMPTVELLDHQVDFL